MTGHRDEQGAKETPIRDHRLQALWAADCAECGDGVRSCFLLSAAACAAGADSHT